MKDDGVDQEIKIMKEEMLKEEIMKDEGVDQEIGIDGDHVAGTEIEIEGGHIAGIEEIDQEIGMIEDEVDQIVGIEEKYQFLKVLKEITN